MADARERIRLVFLFLSIGALGCAAPPRQYGCGRADAPPRIDGNLAEWAGVPWTEDFVDIASDGRPALRTRAKMQWDDEYLYVAAELEEPHVWATLTKHDSIVYRDDDFEVFVDPDGDGRNYFELEINALGTILDLFLVRPYSQGGPHVIGFDFKDLKSAARIEGTINDPSDTDQGWTVEIAIPWRSLSPPGRPPEPGTQWRVDFSRVDWPMRIEGGSYAKDVDKKKPEWQQPSNWVWAPTGRIDIHVPARWGYVRFR